MDLCCKCGSVDVKVKNNFNWYCDVHYDWSINKDYTEEKNRLKKIISKMVEQDKIRRKLNLGGY